MELWELIARERVRDTLAGYTWNGDALRLDDLAAVFHADGELELRGRAPIRGRSAIVEFFTGIGRGGDGSAAPATGRRPIVRHNVANIRFLEVAPTGIRVASYFTVFTEVGLDHHGRYRDTLVPVGDQWLIRHRFVSTDWRAPESTTARPTSPA